MQRLTEALERVTPVLDKLPVGVQLLDADMRYLYLNQVAAEHGKRPRDQLVGRTMQECYPGIEQTELYERIRETLRSGELCELENAFEFPDGSQGWFELRCFRFIDGVVITSVDVTQRKLLQVHQSHSQRMDAARQLAGGIAHDFNNLLTIVGAYTELVLSDSALNPEQRADLGEVLDASRRASELSNRLLALSRHAKGAPQKLDIEACLRTLVRTLASTLGQGVTLQLVIDGEIGAAKIEPTAFEQLIVSLALNARESMQGQGNVSIVARPRRIARISYHADRPSLAAGDYCEIAVIDDGPGIAAAQLDKVFDPRIEGTERVGMGLGLAMCWSLVAQAGGTILVESRRGAGCTFRVLLPQVESVTVAEGLDVLPPVTRAPRSAKVLVVDDEPAIRQLIVRQLESAGHSAIEGVDGEDTLAKLSADHNFDLVVSDVLMPIMGGFELARRIRECRRPVPVLLISGYAPEEYVPNLEANLPVLNKPFTRDMLLEAVHTLLSYSFNHNTAVTPRG